MVRLLVVSGLMLGPGFRGWPEAWPWELGLGSWRALHLPVATRALSLIGSDVGILVM